MHVNAKFDIVAPDAVMPEQFWPATPEQSGEYRLAVAVLGRTCEDLIKYRRAVNPNCRRAFTHAYNWVASDDRRWPYSFLNLCDLLDLPPPAVRSKLLGGRGDRAERPISAEMGGRRRPRESASGAAAIRAAFTGAAVIAA